MSLPGPLISRAVVAKTTLCVLLTAAITGECIAQSSDSITPITLQQALQQALAGNTSIHQAKSSVALAQARVQRESALFDSILTATGEEQHIYQPLTDYEHDLALAAGVNTYQQDLYVSHIQATQNKLFTTGMRVQSTFDLTRLDDNLENIGGVNSSTLNVRLTIPLLGGRGRAITTAPVRSATLQLEGTIQDLNASIASNLVSTAEHFLDLATAEARLRIANQSEQTAEQTRINVASLIEGDKLPAIDLHDAAAAVAQHHIRSINEQEHRAQAQAQLATDMGQDVADAQFIVTAPDSLATPSAPDALQPSAADLHRLIANSLALRAETQADRKRMEAAQQQEKAAQDGLKQRLDLQIASGYNALSLGLDPVDFGRGIENRIGGGNLTGGITYTFNHARNAAHADLATAAAQQANARDVQTLNEQRIAREVVDALASLQASHQALASALQAEDELRQTSEGQRQRLGAGAAALNDVLLSEDRLFDAELSSIEARHRYSVALIRLHYATGTLLGGDAAHPTLDAAALLSASALIPQQGATP